MEKVAIFVDIQNFYYTTKQIYNCHLNYNAFWREATSNREVVKAIAYAIDRSVDALVPPGTFVDPFYQAEFGPHLHRV